MKNEFNAYIALTFFTGSVILIFLYLFSANINLALLSLFLLMMSFVYRQEYIFGVLRNE